MTDQPTEADAATGTVVDVPPRSPVWRIVDQSAPSFVQEVSEAWTPELGAHSLLAFYGAGDTHGTTLVLALWPPTNKGTKYWAVIEGVPG